MPGENEDTFDASSDKPIEKRCQDRLGRRLFAEKTADAIARRHKRGSYVMALQGAWGCGKTSIKNMILDALCEKDNGPIIVDFEPWQLRDADTLFSTFFSEIAMAIGSSSEENGSSSEENKASAKRLVTYGKYLSVGSNALSALGIAGSLIGIPGFKLLEMAGEGVEKIASMSQAASETLPHEGIESLKKELKTTLYDLNRPVLVVIDDIDRLEAEEMMLIFKLVKANADFPNFTYLLLLQRETVEEVVKAQTRTSGRDYLEKIIQLPIDIPLISDAQRNVLFFEGIQEIMQSWEMELTIAQMSDLNWVWGNGLREILLHPRDIRRLLNALEFSGALMTGEAGLEVNLTDFVVLEAWRIQEPNGYRLLSGMKDLLTATWLSPDAKDAAKTRIDALKMSFSDESRVGAENLLEILFPQVRQLLSAEDARQPSGPYQRRDTKLLVHKAHFFDRYFALTIPTDQLSEAKFRRILSVIEQPGRFKESLRELRAQGLLINVLIELRERVSDVSRGSYCALLVEVMDFAEELSSEEGAEKFVPDIYNAYEIIISVLKKCDVNSAGPLLEKAIANSESVILPVMCLREDTEQLHETSTLRWLTEEQVDKLRALLAERVAGKASQEGFTEMFRAMWLIQFWASVDLPAVKDWFEQLLSDDEGLKILIRKFRIEHKIIGTDQVHSIQFDPEVLQWLNNPEDVAGRVAVLDASIWTTEEDRFAAELFVKFVQQSKKL